MELFTTGIIINHRGCYSRELDEIGAGQQLRTTVPIAHRLYEVLKLIQQVLAQHFVVLGIGNAAPKLAK